MIDILGKGLTRDGNWNWELEFGLEGDESELKKFLMTIKGVEPKECENFCLLQKGFGDRV